MVFPGMVGIVAILTSAVEEQTAVPPMPDVAIPTEATRVPATAAIQAMADPVTISMNAPVTTAVAEVA